MLGNMRGSEIKREHGDVCRKLTIVNQGTSCADIIFHLCDYGICESRILEYFRENIWKHHLGKVVKIQRKLEYFISSSNHLKPKQNIPNEIFIVLLNLLENKSCLAPTKGHSGVQAINASVLQSEMLKAWRQHLHKFKPCSSVEPPLIPPSSWYSFLHWKQLRI